MLMRITLLVSAILLGGCGQEILLRDLQERDANEIVAVLYASSIESSKLAEGKGETFAVSVRSVEFPRAVAALQALGLPRQPRPSLNEIFGESSFAPTPFEQKIRYIFGLSQELERTISLMEGTLNTRVHVVIPDNSDRDRVELAKASVFVNFDDRYDIETLVPRIRKLVSDSLEGVVPERVEVLAIPSRVDLRTQGQIPIISFLGVRLHKDDYLTYLIQMGLLVGLLATALAFIGVMNWRQIKSKRGQG